jgi:peptide/nickel transport system substrate-binding protein
MPMNYIQKNGAAYFAQHPVGSGPYKYVSVVPGDSFTFDAWDGYWQGAPAFKTVQIIQVSEETTRVAMLQTGQADLIDASLDNVPPLESKGFSSFVADTVAATMFFHGAYYPAATAGPTSDVRVRQALNLAINRGEIMSSFFYGKASPPRASYVAPLAAGYDETRWGAWVQQNYRYDPTTAKQLLAQAGYANGFSLKLYAYPDTGGAYLPNLAQVIQGYWKAIGVTAQIVATDKGTFASMRSAPAPALIGQASVLRAASNSVATTYFTIGFANSGTGYRLFSNSPTTSSIEVESQIAQINSTADETARNALLSQFIATTTETYIVLEICQVPSIFALSPHVALPANGPLPFLGIGRAIPYAVHSGK